jgi:hypothetical protein
VAGLSPNEGDSRQARVERETVLNRKQDAKGALKKIHPEKTGTPPHQHLFIPLCISLLHVGQQPDEVIGQPDN